MLATVVNIYRPQRSLRRLCFHRCLSTGGEGREVSAPLHAGIQAPMTRGRHPHPWSRHPPGSRHPLPPRADTTPEQTPPGTRHPLPCRARWEIRATNGRYASYWNAYLFNICPLVRDKWILLSDKLIFTSHGQIDKLKL